MSGRAPVVSSGITLATLGDLIDHFHVMRACCAAEGCTHSVQVDLVQLAERIGRDWEFVGATLPMRCSVCGARGPRMMVIAER